MPTYVVMKTNRVVHRYTTNGAHPLGGDEVLEAFTAPHPGPGYFVYETDNTFRAASLQEIRDARVDDTMEAQRRRQLRSTFLQAVRDIRDDATFPPKLRALMVAWFNWQEDR